MPETTQTNDDLALPVGSTIGHYEILGEFRRGGMGIVYRARDTYLDRDVAIKTPRPKPDPESTAFRRFLREGRSASKLSHPNVVQVYEAFEADGAPYIVMELVDGEDLGDSIARGGPLPVERLLGFAEGLAEALRAAHAAGLLHRDIKPRNVLIDRDGRARLTDFGLAHRLLTADDESGPAGGTTVSDSLTLPGGLVGTRAYMSPEQILGLPLTPASDLFSLGTVLYEMCTGRQAFDRAEGDDVLLAILRDEPEPIQRSNPAVPDELARIVDKLLSKRLETRYQGADDLLADLRALRRASESGEVPGVARASPDRRIAWTLGLLAVIVISILAGWGLIPRERDPDAFVPGRPRMLTTSPAWEGEPAVSPDGTMVAYGSDQSGNRDLWLVDAAGGEPLRLTEDPAPDWAPAWFPDGSRIAFTSDRSGRTAIWAVPRLGGPAELLVPDAGTPAISPDGTRIAFGRLGERGLSRISVAPLGRVAEAVVLTGSGDGFWHHTQPSWSPDGRLIAYADLKDIWVVESGGGRPRRLTDDPETDSAPEWSADGRYLFFASTREGTLAIWRMPSEGGPATRVTLGTGPESDPSVSRDGTMIAYSTSAGDEDLVIVDRVAGRRGRIGTVASEHSPALAPDGRGVVFLSDRGGKRELWWQALDGVDPSGPPRLLTRHDAIANLPSFSPDGRYVAYLRVDDNHRDIWIAPMSGELPRPLVDDPATDTHPAWSPDGTQVAFVSDRAGSFDLWLAPVAGGAPAGPPRPLTTGPSTDFLPAWSPDGKRVAFTSDRSGPTEVWMLDLARGGEPRRITDGASALMVRWDGRDAVLVSGFWEDGRVELRRVDVATGRAESLDPQVDFGNPEATGSFAVSPDGRLLALVHEQARGDIWILDGSSREP